MSLAERTLDITLEGRFHFAPGAVARAGDEVRAIGAERALVVTDPGLVAAGIAGRVADLLRAAGLAVDVFAGVSPNPTIANVTAGAAALAAMPGGGAVAIVALGGGSALDAAKAIALAAANPGLPVSDLDYRNEALRPGLPIVAIPTTAGTGSETNLFGVITNETEHRKFYVGNASCRPRLAILDPELTVGLPPRATAATGIDALSHALEGLMARHANPLSIGLALESIRSIGAWLERAVADGSNLEARAQLLLAAHVAGIAQGMTGLGLAHAIAHPLGGRLDVPHGAALGALLPAVMAFNGATVEARLARAAAALDVGSPGDPDRANAAAAVDRVSGLIAAVGLAARLGELGVTADLVGTLADDAMADVVIANTPRMPTSDELRSLILALR